jgi:hypothetical protein
MERQLISIPKISDTLSVYSDIEEIAKTLGASLEQEDEPEIFFAKGSSIYLLWGLQLENKEARRFFIIEKNRHVFQLEKQDKEIEELKAANKAIADRCKRLEHQNSIAALKAEESVSKDLFLQAISAATGKELKRND